MVVFGKEKLFVDVGVGVEVGKSVMQLALLKEFLAKPDWHRSEERLQSGGSEADVGFQQALEFEEGFVVKADVVNVAAGLCRGCAGNIR